MAESDESERRRQRKIIKVERDIMTKLEMRETRRWVKRKLKGNSWR